MKKEKMFYRLNNDGNAIIFHNSGEQVTQLDENIYPVGSDYSTRYEHPYGIVLTIEDAHKIGIKIEN